MGDFALTFNPPPAMTVPRLSFAQLGRKSSGQAAGSQSARELGSRLDAASPRGAFTSRRAEGITPRGRAMLGPRPGDMPLCHTSQSAHASAALVKRCFPAQSRRVVDAHPRAATKVVSTDWLLGAQASLADSGATSPLTGWLVHAVGAQVHVSDETGSIRATLLGPSGPNAVSWSVEASRGAPPLAVPANVLRRVLPSKGEMARVVIGASAGFLGTVLSVDGEVAVVRSAHRSVKVLPLDALCLYSPRPRPKPSLGCTAGRVEAVRTWADGTCEN